MGEIDEKVNSYLSDARRFADLFNAAEFGGEVVVDWMDLKEVSERNYASDGTASTYVDVKRRLVDGAELKILVLENQENVDFEMPLRIMRNDEREYSKQAKQIRKRKRRARAASGKKASAWAERLTVTDKLTPVYTICFYHGDVPWDGPRSLADMMDFGADEAGVWRQLFRDYGMRLVCVDDEGLAENCHTELGSLLRALRTRGDRNKIIQLFEREEFANVEPETAELIAIMLDSEEFKQHKEEYRTEEGGYNMCKGMDDLRKMYRDEGRAQGIEQGIEQEKVSSIRNLMRTMQLTVEQAMDALLVPTEQRESMREKCVNG